MSFRKKQDITPATEFIHSDRVNSSLRPASYESIQANGGYWFVLPFMLLRPFKTCHAA
jgi:hypothetical protein